MAGEAQEEWGGEAGGGGEGGVGTKSASDLNALAMEKADNVAHHMKVEGPHEYVRSNAEFRRGYFASVMTLCLGIMGGAVLPVPWAFSITGMAAGIVLCLVVAAANVFTSDLLIRQCYKTRTRDYEELAYATGGTLWLVITRISILILLFGSIIAGIQQSAEAAIFALQLVTPEGELPSWLLYADDTGYVIMLLFTGIIVFPLCLVKQLRSLEYAGVAGFVIIIILTIAVVVQSIGSGLPAIASGEFQASGFSSMDSVTQAVSVLGFAFYIQPLMMPLLSEMPGPPRSQARILSWAMRFVVVVFAGGVYFFIGFFGAAWYGTSTEGNILQNVLLGGGVAQCVLNFAMALYLSLAASPLEFPMRQILNNWLPGDATETNMLRHVSITTSILVAALAVAMFWHTGSENLLVVTGATGVLMCSYVCPIVNHFLLYFNLADCQRSAKEEYEVHLSRAEGSHYGGHVAQKVMEEQAVSLGEALPPFGESSLAAVGMPGVLTYRRNMEGMSAWEHVSEYFSEIVVPLAISVIGVFCSIVSLYSAFKPEEDP